MKRGGIITLVGALGLVALLVAGSAGAFPPEGPLVQGGAPPLISYQGLLTDPGTGDPVADGDYNITFALYDVEFDGSPIWSETQTVSVNGGLFNVLLGSETALSASLFDGTGRWVEVEVEGEVLSPRRRFASVPYAFQAQGAADADLLDGHDAAYFQRRVTDSCTVGSTIRAVNADGTVVCQTDARFNRPTVPTANTVTTLDSGGQVGTYTSVTIGSDGLGLISYWVDLGDNLKAAHCANVFCVPYFRRR